MNAFWRCLFGKEGDGRRLISLSSSTVSSKLRCTRTEELPEKVANECVKSARYVAQFVTFRRPRRLPHEQPFDGLRARRSRVWPTLNTWAEGAGKRVETKQRENKIVSAGDTWSTTDKAKQGRSAAWQYDKFIHCAVPNIDKMRRTVRSCSSSSPASAPESKTKGWKTDPSSGQTARYLHRRSDGRSLPKTPRRFRATFNKFSADYDRLSQAWESCLRKMSKESKKDDLEQFDKAWVDSVNASTKIRKIARDNPALTNSLQRRTVSSPACPLPPSFLPSFPPQPTSPLLQGQHQRHHFATGAYGRHPGWEGFCLPPVGLATRGWSTCRRWRPVVRNGCCSPTRRNLSVAE